MPNRAAGAIQHKAALMDANFIVAVNKNLDATMMKFVDVAIVADANQVCSGLSGHSRRR